MIINLNWLDNFKPTPASKTKLGTKKEVTKFVWFPIIFNGNLYWLEFLKITYAFLVDLEGYSLLKLTWKIVNIEVL